MLYIYPRPNRRTTIYPSDKWHLENLLSNFLASNAVILNSARVGLYEILRFFGMSRSDNVLVPDFLGQCVLGIINRVGFPVKKVDEKTKVVLVLHQWGYPQKMDEVMGEAKKRDLLVIEDCAHSLDSKYKGMMTGSWGDASVYSFPKIFPVVMGGAITSKNNKLIKYIKKIKKENSSLYLKLVSGISYLALKRARNSSRLHGHDFVEVCYSQFHRLARPNFGSFVDFPSVKSDLMEALQKRKTNYKYLINNIKKDYLISDDQSIDVNPLCLPVFVPLAKMNSVLGQLAQKNIFGEIMHFDINRNVFNSNYKKCLAIPCHQFAKEDDLEIIVDVVNNI